MHLATRHLRGWAATAVACLAVKQALEDVDLSNNQIRRRTAPTLILPIPQHVLFPRPLLFDLSIFVMQKPKPDQIAHLKKHTLIQLHFELPLLCDST